METAHQSHNLAYLKLTGAAFLWGGTFVAGKFVAQKMPHLFSASMRFLIAWLLLTWFITQRQRHHQPTQTLSIFWQNLFSKSIGVPTFLMGFLGIFIYNLCFFGSLSHIQASRAALFVALNPILTAVFGVLFFREHLHKQAWFGVVIALVGTLIVITRGHLETIVSGAFGLGECLMFIAVTAWVFFTFANRRALKHVSAINANWYASFWGMLMLLIVMLIDGVLHTAVYIQELRQIGWYELIALVYLGLFGTAIAFVWYSGGLQQIGSSRSAIFANLVPVFGVLLSVLVLGEHLLWSMVLGGTMVIAGVLLTNGFFNQFIKR